VRAIDPCTLANPHTWPQRIGDEDRASAVIGYRDKVKGKERRQAGGLPPPTLLYKP
jgi:hypothetical protein